jgi:putative ABC transport system permease protein
MDTTRRNRILKSGFSRIKSYKLRTFFMMLGIIIGITALSLTLTLGNGIEKKIMQNVSKIFNSNNIVITAEMIDQKGPRQKGDSPNATLKIQDIEAIASQLGNVVGYDYTSILAEQTVSFSGQNVISNIKGCSETGEHIWNRPVSSGSFFIKEDVKSSKRVAVIGSKIASTLFPSQNPIGQQIRIANNPFQVVGVLEPRGMDPHGMDLDEDIMIPITTFMDRVNNVDYIMAAKFEFANEETGANAIEPIRKILRERHSLTDNEADDFSMITPALVKSIIADMTKVFRVLLPAIAVISLLVGGIVIVVLMSTSVNQRIKEIGLRKAIGANESDIWLQFMVESVFIVMIGGLIGLVLGLVLSKISSNKLDAIFYIPWQTIVAGIVLPIITGLLAGVLPANKAAKCQPVETLK